MIATDDMSAATAALTTMPDLVVVSAMEDRICALWPAHAALGAIDVSQLRDALTMKGGGGGGELNPLVQCLRIEALNVRYAKAELARSGHIFGRCRMEGQSS